MVEALTEIKIPGVKKYYSGKVRDLYKVDDEHLLIVATDRVSAFDYVFPNGIPGKGKMLNTISNLWFKAIPYINNHIVETDAKNFPAPFNEHVELLEDRSVIVKKTKRINFECVARGYIIGSGWKDYQATGAVCGIPLPEGLQLAQKLDAPIFTPATKADTGHDENITVSVMTDSLGEETSQYLASTTLQLYEYGRDMMDKVGIILADTKFEFGIHDNEIILIDEVLTPDSSRFWDKDKYAVGTSPASFDKQFIRDYLDNTTWDKNSPAPPLPDEVVAETEILYQEILKRIKSIIK